MTDERQIIQRAQNGDLAAFRELVDTHKKRIYFLALDLTGNPQDAQDLSQDVFIKAYQSLNKFRGDSQFGSWLYRITVNTNINQYRKKSFKARKIQASIDEEINEMRPQYEYTGNDTPEVRTESQMIQKHIDGALDSLSSRERSVFVLRHYHDLSLNEIAQSLKITTGTVKSTLFRAIQKMRSSLEFYKEELGLEVNS